MRTVLILLEAISAVAYLAMKEVDSTAPVSYQICYNTSEVKFLFQIYVLIFNHAMM